jgi:hypothetical protein
MYYAGESNVPGAPGNLLAGSPSFQIGPRSPFKGMSREALEELKQFDDRPQDLQRYYEQQNNPGPRLFPLAGIPGSSNLPGAVGNMQGMVNAQFYGGPQLGQIPPGFDNKIVS